MGRAPSCEKAKVKKGPWSSEEDEKLRRFIEEHGNGGNWVSLPQKIGLNRCGKSCRLRWLNYLRPDIKHGNFSEEEENIIISFYRNIGSRWSTIAAQLPGRTDNDIKNYWNTTLKKRFLGKYKRTKQENNSLVKKEVKETTDTILMASDNTNQTQCPVNIHLFTNSINEPQQAFSSSTHDFYKVSMNSVSSHPFSFSSACALEEDYSSFTDPRDQSYYFDYEEMGSCEFQKTEGSEFYQYYEAFDDFFHGNFSSPICLP